MRLQSYHLMTMDIPQIPYSQKNADEVKSSSLNPVDILIDQEPRGWTRKKLQEFRFSDNAFP